MAHPLASQPLCPVPGGLDGTRLRERVDWFCARHAGQATRVLAWLWHRPAGLRARLAGSQSWHHGRLLPRPPGETQAHTFLAELPELKGERWLILAAEGEPSAQTTPLYRIRPEVAEVYTYRDGGQEDDRLELVEQHRCQGDYWTRFWMPAAAARPNDPQPPAPPRRSRTERWQELAVSDEWRQVAADPDQVLGEAREKLQLYPGYHFAALQARARPGVSILELGSNHWPVMPLGVFDSNPTAVFHTVDCHYQGLWAMEQIVAARHPHWLPRIHRYLADFSQPLPITDGSIEVAVSEAAFVTENFTAAECRAILQEVHRVLAPGGRFFLDCFAPEARPAWLTWAMLQRFSVEHDWGAGWKRTLCLKRLS